MTFDLEDAKKRGCLHNGMPARIVCSDRVGPFPLVVLTKASETREHLSCFQADGRADWGSLENLPREVTVWAAIVDGETGFTFSREDGAAHYCEVKRDKGHAAGYAPVTIKLTR